MKMKKVYILFLCCFVLMACSKPPDLTADNSKIEEIITGSDLGRYVEEISYKLSEESSGGKDVYYADIIIKAKDSFDTVETMEKLEEMEKLNEAISSNRYYPINCGSPFCKLKQLVFKTSTNEYSVYDDWEASSMSWPLVLATNGEITLTWEQLREENSKIAQQQEAEKAANEPKTNGVPNGIIYYYMKAAYDDLTNYGADYVPEIHDPMVSKLAAERFGITPEQADQIYIDGELERQ